MPRKPTGKPNQRPEKPIDWKIVDELLMSNCTGIEVACYFDMHPNTFYDRVTKEYGVGFTEYSSSKKTKGQSLLRHTQFRKALGIGKGDNTMLIWLGKQWLGQKETANETSISTDILDHYGALMNQIKELQSSDLKIEENNNKTESKS